MKQKRCYAPGESVTLDDETLQSWTGFTRTHVPQNVVVKPKPMNRKTKLLLRLAALLASEAGQHVVVAHYQKSHYTPKRYYGYLVRGGAATMHDTLESAVLDAMRDAMKEN
jgi:hypothetical protein